MLEQDVYDHVEAQHSDATRNKDFEAMKIFWSENFEFYESPIKPGDMAWIKIQHSKIETGVGK